MSGWTVEYDRFDPAGEGLRETLCTVGNGYFATRGAAPEAVADEVHYPATYLAGCFNRLESEIAGARLEHESNPNLPNWLPLTFRIADGAWFRLEDVEILDYRQALDLRLGVLTRTVRFRADGRETLLTQRRFAHMAEPHLACLESTLLPIGWSGTVVIRSALDARVRNAGVARYRDLASDHLEPLGGEAVDGETIALRVRTTQSRIEIVEAARTRVLANDEPRPVARELTSDVDYVAHDLVIKAEDGRPITVEKVVAIFSSRDRAVSEPGVAAREALRNAPSLEALLSTHILAWEHLWRRFSIDMEDVTEHIDEVLALNVHIFHLLQSVSSHTIDLDAGVPARGLHGEAYRGHIFWDELFVLPLLNYRVPELTRALLLYRYRRLPVARRRAREAGSEGALFPWQSGSDGREESQTLHLNPRSRRWFPDRSYLQRHINIAVAQNVLDYFEVTGDAEFMRTYGLELLIETNRFWSSIATYNRALDRFDIRKVMGPDEYHDAYPDASEPGIDNNAYTNVMVAYLLERTLTILGDLPDRQALMLRERLGLAPGELERWRHLSRRLRVVFHDGPEGPVISQFEGYERLEELDWSAYRERYGDIQRMDRILEAEGDSSNRYKVSKQADVLMLFYLLSAEELEHVFRQLGYDWDYHLIPRNIRYYVPRTSNGSTLSRVVHAWVLARSQRPQSWQFFESALRSDLADIQGGTTREGIHLGAMAGTIDIVQRCWTGLEPRGDALRFNPVLPDELRRIQFELRYRLHDLSVDVTPATVRVRADAGTVPPIRVAVGEETQLLEAGGTVEFTLNR